MEQEKGRSTTTAVWIHGVQFFDSSLGSSQQDVILVGCLSLCVHKVRNQTKENISISVHQVSSLQIGNQLFDTFDTGEHRRNNDHGSMIV
ncbi:hypothetical protein D3C80_1794770 [compost metagenome]